MQLEGQRLSVLGFEIVDVRLRREVELLAIDDFLERRLDESFNGFLANGRGELLPHHACGRLAGAKAGETHLARVALGRTVLRLLDLGERHGHFEEALEPLGLDWSDVYLHGGKITRSHAR